MRERLLDDDTLIIALVEYHDDLRERDPERALRAWKRAQNLAADTN